MRSPFVLLVFPVVLILACESTQRRELADVNTVGPIVAEAGCATCIYDMPDVQGCVLAVKIDGKSYRVEGSGIDDHGDAHAADGLCNTARRARIAGRIEARMFVAEQIELLPP
jgi:hypothetical protein